MRAGARDFESWGTIWHLFFTTTKLPIVARGSAWKGFHVCARVRGYV